MYILIDVSTNMLIHMFICMVKRVIAKSINKNDVQGRFEHVDEYVHWHANQCVDQPDDQAVDHCICDEVNRCMSRPSELIVSTDPQPHYGFTDSCREISVTLPFLLLLFTLNCVPWADIKETACWRRSHTLHNHFSNRFCCRRGCSWSYNYTLRYICCN